MLSVTELVVGERALVVGAGVSNRLGADDPELAEVIDQLVGSGLDGTNYVGGYPHWVQHAAYNAPLIAQLDFDGISLDDDGWSDAGLFGVLYVFDDGDGDATVMWQYT